MFAQICYVLSSLNLIQKYEIPMHVGPNCNMKTVLFFLGVHGFVCRVAWGKTIPGGVRWQVELSDF